MTLTLGHQKREVAKELSLQKLNADGLLELLINLKDTFDDEAVDVAFQYYVKLESLQRADVVDKITSRQCVGMQVTALLENRCQRAKDATCNHTKVRVHNNEVLTETNSQRYCKRFFVFVRTSDGKAHFCCF